MPIPICLASLALTLAPAQLPEKIELSGPWRLLQAERKIDIPAHVPGVAQTDLMRAGLIPDPYLGLNEKAVQWVSDVPWSLTRTFNIGPDFLRNRRIVLQCEGLDTYATIRVNGREVAKTDNMFRRWEFDAKPYLIAGENTIQVDFETIASFLARNEDRPNAFDRPIQEGGKAYIRKPAFQGGWDFSPRLLTTGIWRDIRLVGWDAGRLTEVGVVQDHSKKGEVGLGVRLKADVAGAAVAHATVLYKGRKVAETDTTLVGGKAEAKLIIANPKLWWPVGMGTPNLYDLRVELRDPKGQALDRDAHRVGLRTVTWIPKTKETALALVVNGRRFFAKGSNWVPTDSLLRDDPARVRKLIQHAVDANMNLMRLWGGGYYETDAFFDTCDEKGLLVWFEFGYACSPYPSFDPVWLDGAREEAKDVVRRIQSHPSIAVYSGNNEVTDRITEKTTAGTMSREEYELLFHKTLRDVVHEYAPDAAYTPGSPEVGDTHYWTVWHGPEGFDAYQKLHGFMSEYGYQALAVPRTIEAYTTPEERATIETPAILNHHKNWRDAHALIVSMMRRAYRKPKDVESTIWLSQIQQANGIVSGIEHWRRDWPNSTASLVWQYNDPWPGTSWSMIDYYNRPKALLYRLKHAYAPIVLTAVADAGTVDLWVASDRTEAKRSAIDWSLMRTDGTVVRKGSLAVAIPAGTCSVQATKLNLADAISKEGAENLILIANLRTPGEADSETTLLFGQPKEVSLQDPKIQTMVSKQGDGYAVTLRSDRPALHAWISLEGMDAEYSDNFVTVAPGHPVTIQVRTEKPSTVQSVQAALKARSLFDTYLPGTEANPISHAAADGSLTLTAELAEIRGEAAFLESGTPSNIGNWVRVEDGLRWTVKGAKPGTYRVTADVAIPDVEAGSAFEVSVQGRRLTGTVPGTGGWYTYRTITLGEIQIDKGGDIYVELTPKTRVHDHVMNLRSLTFSPVQAKSGS